MKPKYEAQYEVEVNLIALNEKGVEADSEGAEKLIKELDPHYYDAFTTYNQVTAEEITRIVATVYFDNFVAACGWKKMARARLAKLYPEHTTRAFCGVNVFGYDGEPDICYYFEIVKENGEVIASNAWAPEGEDHIYVGPEQLEIHPIPRRNPHAY